MNESHIIHTMSELRRGRPGEAIKDFYFYLVIFVLTSLPQADKRSRRVQRPRQSD
jgi:hypothetical protein